MRNKKPARRNIGIDIDLAVIDKWRTEGVGRCELICCDATAFLRHHSFSGDEVVYADPPYLSSTRRKKRIYLHEYSEVQHVELLDELKKLPCPVVISGYWSELYGDILSGWEIQTYQANTQSGLREEFLWMNFKPPAKLHDFSYIGRDFREREASKRRLNTLKGKIERLTSIERASLTEWLAEQQRSAQERPGPNA